MILYDRFKTAIISVCFIALINTHIFGQNNLQRPLYLDPSQPIEKRIDDLLGRMTLGEKIGQINMPVVRRIAFGKDVSIILDRCQKFAEGKLVEGVGSAGGYFKLIYKVFTVDPRKQAESINEFQKIALEKTRLKIPFLITEEGTHGSMCPGATIFPEGPTIGSTWNMDLVNKIYAIAAKEARAVGIHQLFTLVVEPIRDPRLGRNEEGYSEDPYLCSRIAEEIVEGVQGDDVSAIDKVIAGLCHYPGQSEPVSGLERGPMEISERKLREVFLPPWVAGITKKGALGVMATYPAVDGVPVHASKKILTKILREELGFDGLVLAEGRGISTLIYEHVAATQKQAGELALKAGVDVGITFEDAYLIPMIENVKEGRISMDLIDRSVRRVLEQKFRLGLFEKPYVDPERAEKIMNTKESQDVALQAAREGIVLLKNESNLLPLKKSIKSIAVIGPNADHERNQLGDYTSRLILQDIVTVLDGIEDKVSPKTKIKYVKGCKVIGNDLNEISEAVKAAKSADIAVVVLGENEWNDPDRRGTNGEGRDVASLDLTGLQEDLLKAVHGTGTPTVLVLINGRALSIRWAAENIPAIVEAWLPGEKGGEAVADIMFGDFNPNGRLSVTIPRHVGQLPCYYNYMPSREWWLYIARRGPYRDMSAEPLWEFGHGLSYTKFEYSNLKISSNEIGPYGEIMVNLDIENTGGREGAEVVQLYIRDIIATVSVPVKQLRGFKKVWLNPGEKKRVEFKLNHEDLSLLNQNLEWVVEPGTFDIMVGSSSKNILLKGNFEVKN
ncbi:glycoside hydrolase family 3 C-terminal domain-containing protein [candidate division KSB1 bacterium]